MAYITCLKVMYYSPHLAKELMIFFPQKSTLHQATRLLFPLMAICDQFAAVILTHRSEVNRVLFSDGRHWLK